MWRACRICSGETAAEEIRGREAMDKGKSVPAGALADEGGCIVGRAAGRPLKCMYGAAESPGLGVMKQGRSPLPKAPTTLDFEAWLRRPHE